MQAVSGVDLQPGRLRLRGEMPDPGQLLTLRLAGGVGVTPRVNLDLRRTRRQTGSELRFVGIDEQGGHRSDRQQTLAGMRRTVNAAEKTVKGLNDNLAPQLMGTIQSLKKTLDSADRTLVSANRTLASDSPTQEELQQTLRSVSKAADSLRRLTDYLERHPESLLRGKTGN